MRALGNFAVFALAIVFCWLALWDDVLPPGWRQDVLAATAHPNAWPVALMLAGAMMVLAAWAEARDRRDALRKSIALDETYHLATRQKLMKWPWWRLPLVMRWGLGVLAVPASLPWAAELGLKLEDWYATITPPDAWAPWLDGAVPLVAMAGPILLSGLCARVAVAYADWLMAQWWPQKSDACRAA